MPSESTAGGISYPRTLEHPGRSTLSSQYGSAWIPIALCVLGSTFAVALRSAPPESPPRGPKLWAEIRIVDAATKRGVPMVELETVDGIRFVTDNAGRVAFQEPGLMGQEIFFSLRTHGYEVPRDGFHIAGIRATPEAGIVRTVELRRQNLAERLCRLTGEGLYRDSVLLGHDVPMKDSLNPGRVAGQDSVQAAIHNGKVWWLWGDTSRMGYPLGLFRTAGATTPIPDPKRADSDPASGIAFDYFLDKTGFVRAMMPLAERPEGVIWIFALFRVPDDRGIVRLYGHYSRRKGLDQEYEHGIARLDEEKAAFEPLVEFPLEEKWRRPTGHPIEYEEGGTKWLLFGSPTPNVRVPATLEAVRDPARYEAFTCANDKGDGPALAADGKPTWRWQKALPPTDSKTERMWIAAKKLAPGYARFCPADAGSNSGERIVLHSGSVRFNEFRRCWVMVAGQIEGKSSHLGEVWYAESKHPCGPFAKAVRVLTHDRQTFYNVCHHGFLDRDGGRTIHFEGTYTNDFSGNPEKTPRYNYNQILYRLDLDGEKLKSARGE